MRFFDSLGTALSSLRANILRSVLTTLGIIIGVAAVIIMIAVGEGAEARVDAMLRSLGTNVMFVVPGAARSGRAALGSGTWNTITTHDAAAIRQEIDDVAFSVPVVRGNRQIVFGTRNWSSRIYGIEPDYLPARDWPLGAGRNFTDMELRRAAKVALLGKTVIKELFPDGQAIGRKVRIAKTPFLIVGVLGERGQTALGTDQDDAVMIPLTTAKKRVLGGRRRSGALVDFITVKVETVERIVEVENEIGVLLRQRHRLTDNARDDFRIRNLADLLNKRKESTQLMSMLLAAVATISMVVGGIGIMNIMLVSVSERTREIGLRIALGARRGDILQQFLIEAIVLSMIGGCIGVLLGIVGTQLASDLLPGFGSSSGGASKPLFRPYSAVLSFSFAGFVGVFFGFYPALRASKLDPIEALRHD